MSLIKKPSELDIPSTVKMMIYGQAGMGKAQPLFCNVLTPCGYKKLGDIKIGDEIMNPNGEIQKVLGVYPQGIRPVYKITTNDSAVTYCDEEHIWNVRLSSGNSRKSGFRNITLKEMISKGILCKKTPREQETNRKATPRFEIPVVKPMVFDEKIYEIDPYILGVLIGDGSLTGNVALFSNPDFDSEIKIRIDHLLPKEYCLYKNESPKCPQYSIVRNNKSSNVEGYIQKVIRLGLNELSLQKFIPESYKFGSIMQRLSLLRGLMDTDGCAINNRIYYSTSSKKLAYDVVELVNSLGGIGKIHIYERPNANPEYRVGIRINMCPFTISRKANEWRPTKVSRYISEAIQVKDEECVCIKVSGDNELFITDNYIVTHNTTLALSAPKPLLLDFDNGVKRINMSHLEGVDIVQITKWQDVQQVLQENLSAYETIVIDTVGKMMDFIISFKCGTRQPSIRDWGGINQEFTWLTRTVSSLNKNVVFVAHRDTRKEGDDTVFIPALREKSYNAIVTELDVLGYLEMKNENGHQVRTITFDPTSRNDGKNTCNLPGIISIPTIIDASGKATAKNDFIQASVITPYISMLSVKKVETEKYNALISEIKEGVSQITDAQSAQYFTEHITDYKHVGSSLMKARSLFSAKIKELGLSYDKETKTYVDSKA